MERVLVVERDGAIAQCEREPESVSVVRPRQYQLLERLIVEGSDALALHVCRRLQADRTSRIGPTTADTLTWVEIAEWAKRERLLNGEEVPLLQLLHRLAGFMPRRARAGSA
jgi:hypothetical protein